MTEQQIKQQVLLEMRKALQNGKAKKGIKKYKYIYGQWSTATEKDILIIPMQDMEIQKITSFSFSAQAIDHARSVEYSKSFSRKQDKIRLSNDMLNFENAAFMYDAIYNIDCRGISQMKKAFAREVFDFMGLDYYLIFNKSIEEEDGYFLLDLEDVVKESCIDIAEKNRAWNNAGEYFDCATMNYIEISNWSFDKSENVNVPAYSAVALRIKGKTGEELFMYVGRYNETTQKIEEVNVTDSHTSMIIFDKADKKREPQKGLLGWKI